MLGELNKGWVILDKVLEKAAVAQCAEMVGGARQAMAITLDYAKQRKTFGHPIGSYQAIQHYCSNMLVDVDGCSLVMYNAAWRLSQGLPATEEVAMAKVLLNESFKRVAATCIQIHGAIGFAEDHDVSLYVKLAKTWEASFGGTDFHLDKIAKAAQI